MWLVIEILERIVIRLQINQVKNKLVIILECHYPYLQSLTETQGQLEVNLSKTVCTNGEIWSIDRKSTHKILSGLEHQTLVLVGLS